ncbi:hypothetical protein [Deinococcus sp. NW-56]|uniref:hypothetical protein n=1 Tax=Deinococcus sp. NW-56 TaxID=2080419 RepID=UPI000CF49A1C|nr:hypothetical protein [Deinococcus sp. NW-56]
MTKFIHKIDRVGFTGRLFAYFESQGATGPEGVAGLGRAQGLPVGEYDAEGWLKAEGLGGDYIGTASKAGVHRTPPRLTLTVMQDGMPALSDAFSPVETADGVLDINAALRAGRPLTTTPEQLRGTAELLAEGQTLLPELRQALADTAQTRNELVDMVTTLGLLDRLSDVERFYQDHGYSVTSGDRGGTRIIRAALGGPLALTDNGDGTVTLRGDSGQFYSAHNSDGTLTVGRYA